MKKIRVLALCALTAALFMGCWQAQLDDSSDAAGVAAADAKTAAILQAVAEARVSGDYSRLQALVQAEDRDGELSAILARHGALERPAARFGSGQDPLGIPHFYDDGVYENGDVLLCRGSGTITSDLMTDVLPRGYGHSGMLWKPDDMPPLDDFPCVASSTLSLQDNGVCMQTYEEWDLNDTVCVMRWNDAGNPISSEDVDAAVAHYQDAYVGHTSYGFLRSGDIFMPVTKNDESVWYCSKVPYRIYRDFLGQDVERSDFYGSNVSDTSQRWAYFTYSHGTPSLMYDVYWWYLRIFNPFKSKSWVTKSANTRLIYVLGELVSPDELRWSLKLGAAAHFGATTPEDDWGL